MAETGLHLPSDEFAFQQSSPHSLRDTFSSPAAAPLNVESNDAFDIPPRSLETDDGLILDPDLTQISPEDRRSSIVSSVSTFPGSVLYNDPLKELRTPSRSARPPPIKHDSFESFVSSSSRRREHAAAFRNPSSVRAMQMKDGDETESVIRHQRSGSQFSTRSHGSGQFSHTSPSKRHGRSSQSSPLKNGSKLRKEFPLVLLHCTLLPPANGTLSPYIDSDLFGALLPETYRKRWTALQDRFAMAEVKTRGILIPHPQEDYELLEERLLESLDLEKPRIRSSHFLHHDATGPDSGFESASQTDEESEDNLPHDLQCPDCGKGIDLLRERKWNIKVYAANGLMRAGAWAAAWREMEKVDVEIGLWMPEDVWQEVNSRLDAIKACEHDAESEQQSFDDKPQDSRQREIYGAARHAGHHPGPGAPNVDQESVPFTTSSHQSVAQEKGAGLVAYLDRGSAILFNDQRNVLMLLLSILIMYILIGTNGSSSASRPSSEVGPSAAQVATMTVTSTAVFTPTTSLAGETSSTTLLADSSSAAVPSPSSTASVDEKSSPDPSTLRTTLQNLAEAILPDSAESLDQDEG